MKCPNCQTEMAQSKIGWLCPNCGHLELESATTLDSDSAPKSANFQYDPKSDKTVPDPEPKVTESDSTDEKQLKLAPESNTDTAQPQPSLEPPIAANAALSPSPKPARHQVSWQRLIVIGLAVIVILALGGYGYVLAAKKPYQDFQTKLAAAKTLSFKGSLKFSATGFLSSFGSDLNFAGHYDHSSATNGDLNFKGTWASQQYDGQAVLNGGSVFFKLTGQVLPVIRYNQSSFLYPLTTDWYKTKLDNSLYGNYCETRADSRYPNGLELYRLLKGLKTANSPLVNPLASLNGRRATEYNGKVDSAQLPDLLKQINAQLPEGCGLEYYSPPTDPKKLTVKYSLLTTAAADRFNLTFDDKSVGAKIDFSVDLSGYNQPVTIAPPASSIDLNAVRQSQLDILNRDHTRRNDLDKLKAALEAYAAANKKLYPASLSVLAPKFLAQVPTDPKTHQVYSYTLGPGRKSFTVSANLEEPNAGVYMVTGP